MKERRGQELRDSPRLDRRQPAVGKAITRVGAPRGKSAASAGASPAAGSAAAGALDESAQRQERSRLIAELALFRDMAAETVEQMPLGFLALDHELRVTYANPVALMLVGVSLADLVGRRPWNLLPEIAGTQHQTIRTSAGFTLE
jgi:PAS domain-containing protein